MSAETAASAGPIPPVARAAAYEGWRTALVLCAAFFLVGVLLIPYAGIQNDEALFAAGIYNPRALEHTLPILHHQVPVLLMSYLGAVKTLAYKPVFRLWPPSPYSVRVPMLVAGAVTIFLSFLLVGSVAGKRAALTAAALLAADATYLLTTCFDWGPVALQHLFTVGGLAALAAFHTSGKRRWLGAGFFLFGLAMWDKALFSWTLSGLVVASAVTLPRILWPKLRPVNLAVAALAFLAGAAPLMEYNLQHGFVTFRSNAQLDTSDLHNKAVLVESTLDGSSLFGYVVRDHLEARPGQPRNALERVLTGVSDLTGHAHEGFYFYATAICLLLLPWLWRTPARQPMLFAAVFLAVAWPLMALTKGAGGGSHHTVLLWPFPHLLMGTAMAQASERFGEVGRRALVIAVATLAALNLLVVNEHVVDSIRNGPTAIWTDAVYPLSAAVERRHAAHVFVIDWGILDPLRLLNRGSLPLEVGSDEVSDGRMTAEQRRAFLEHLAEPDSIWVGHVPATEVFVGVRGRLLGEAERAGYRPADVQTVADRFNRPIFEIFRLAPVSAATPPSGK